MYVYPRNNLLYNSCSISETKEFEPSKTISKILYIKLYSFNTSFFASINLSRLFSYKLLSKTFSIDCMLFNIIYIYSIKRIGVKIAINIWCTVIDWKGES